jgi:hypothetical protein
MSVLNTSLSQYKSSFYEICRTLLNSRTFHSAKVGQLSDENLRLRDQNAKITRELEEARREAQQLRELLEKKQLENSQLQERAPRLPSDVPIPGHSFGPKLICVCLNLAKRIGFRPTSAALEIIFEYLGIDAQIPSWDSIRCWACRMGIAILDEHEQTSEDEMWIVDHSNQIGQEKILVINRLRQRDLPPPGKTLKRSNLKTIATIAGKSWTKDDVRREYAKLAGQRGAPKYLLSDGAVELHETADGLGKHKGNEVITIRDMKHKAANILESLIGKDARFTDFMGHLGRTRSQIQQTELGHFTPPPQKTKARFMNLGPMLRWGQMVSYHLSHPHSRSRGEITAARMNDKLSWLSKFSGDIALWNECESVMQHCLGHLERHAVQHGTVAQLRKSLEEAFPNWQGRAKMVQQMGDRLLDAIGEIESKLAEGDRVWAMSDNLESGFGGFKRLEGQHSKGGFTSLIAALPLVFEDLTPERVKTGLQLVPVKRMKEWVKTSLGETLTAKRQRAYAEACPRPSGQLKPA